jgi:hypothetical protein
MNRKQTIRRILRESYCRLAPSTIHGVGVFAVRDIPRGIDPFAIRMRYPRGWVAINPLELERAPAGLRNLLASLFVPDADGAFRIPVLGTNLVDIGAYLNHSDRPNVRTPDGHRFLTRRRIRGGEEMTVDYATYGAAECLGIMDRAAPSRSAKAVRLPPGQSVT